MRRSFIAIAILIVSIFLIWKSTAEQNYFYRRVVIVREPGAVYLNFDHPSEFSVLPLEKEGPGPSEDDPGKPRE